MPTMDEYAASGGYARDAQAQRNVTGVNNFTGGSSVTNRSKTNVPKVVQPVQPAAPSAPAYSGLQRYNPNADAADRLNYFKNDTFEAQKELAIVKQMYADEQSKGATADRLGQISSWADQVRGASGISNDDPVFGNSANQSDANVQSYISGLTKLDQAKYNAQNGLGNQSDLLGKYQQMLQGYMSSYQQQLATLKQQQAAEAQKAQAEREARKQGMLKGFKSQYDSALAGQQADLSSAKAQSVAELEKAYQDAVANGDMSVRQAKEAFDAHKKELEKQQYQASQSRNLLASQRGIGNSQQLLGMQTTDQSNFNNLQSSAMTARDQQLADIKSRLDSLNNTKSTENARINEQYNQNLNKAKSQSDFAYQSAVNNLDVNDYNADRNFSEQLMAANRSMDLGSLNAQLGQMNQLSQGMFQSDLQARSQDQQLQNAIALANNGNLNQLSILAKAQGYNLENMAVANGYDMDKMKNSQEFQQMMAGIMQGYTQSNAKDNYGYQIGLQNNQGGIQMGLQNNQFGHQASLQGAANSNQLEMLRQKGVIDRENAMAKSDQEYRQAVERESAKYTPGTPEYDIMMKQMKAAKDQRENDIREKYNTETQIKEAQGNPNLPAAKADLNQFGSIQNPENNFLTNMADKFNGSIGLTDWMNNSFLGNLFGGAPNPNNNSEYQSKLSAYDRYLQSIGAK